MMCNAWDRRRCGNEWACNAAASGHVGVLQLLRSQDPPCQWNEGACRNAAARGHLGVLRWLRSQQPPCPWDQRVVAEALA